MNVEIVETAEVADHENCLHWCGTSDCHCDCGELDCLICLPCP